MLRALPSKVENNLLSEGTSTSVLSVGALLVRGIVKKNCELVISGKSLHKVRRGSRQVHEQKQFQMFIDIQTKMAEGKSVGY